MQVVGPINLSAGLQLLQNDPAKFTPPNTSVQLQNYSGFGITGQIGGNPFAIPPFTASTLHFTGVGQLNATVSSTISAGSGTLTLVWLLPIDVNPVKDGPLTAFATSSKTLTVTGGGTGVATISGVGPSDINMTIYTSSAQGTGSATVTVVGVQSGLTYLNAAQPTGVNIAINVPINGAADTSYTVTIIGQNLVAAISATQVVIAATGTSWGNAIATGMPVAPTTGQGGIAMNGNQVVLFPSSGTGGRFSTDGGNTWASMTFPAAGAWKGFYVGGGVFVAAIPGTTSGAWSNNGGSTWTAATMPSAATWSCAAGNGSGLVAWVSSGTAVGAFSSNGGSTYAASVLNALATSVAWTGNTFLGVGNAGGTTQTSPTGQTWSAAAANGNGTATSVLASGAVISGGFVSGLASASANGTYFTPNSGVSWTVGSATINQTYVGVALTASGFVALSSTTSVQVSTSGQGAYVAGTAIPSGAGLCIACGGAAVFSNATAASSTN